MNRRLVFGCVPLFLLLLALVGRMPAQAATGPVFQILQPLPGQLIMGDTLPMAIAFQTPEDAMVVRYEAFVDGKELNWGQVTKPIPVGTFRVDSKLAGLKLGSGSHTLAVKLFDAKGRVSVQQQTFEIKPLDSRPRETNPPRVRIVSPRTGEVISPSMSTTVKVEATDDTGVKYVLVYLNGTMRVLMNEAPYEWSWMTSKEVPGFFTLVAKALDFWDNEGRSDLVTVEIPRQPSLIDPLVYTPAPVPSTSLPTIPVGPIFERMLPSNLVPPLLSWQGTPPAVSGNPMIIARGELPTEAGGMLVVLPVKRMPGSAPTAQTTAGMGTLDATVAPVLAMRPGSIDRLPTAGVSLPAVRGILLVPQTGTPASRDLPVDHPVLIALAPPMTKGTPQVRETITLPGVTVAPGTTITGPQLPAGPARIATTPGMPSGYTPVTTTPTPQLTTGRGDNPLPVIVAMVPTKGQPQWAETTESSPAAVSVHAQQPLSPRPSSTVTRPTLYSPLATTTPSTVVGPDPATTPRTTLPDAPQPMLVAWLPTKGQPSGTQKTTLPRLGPLDQQQGVTPRPAQTPARPVLTSTNTRPMGTLPGTPDLTLPPRAMPPAGPTMGSAPTRIAKAMPSQPLRRDPPTPAGLTPSTVAPAGGETTIEVRGHYTIKPKDTLQTIASAFGTTPQVLAQLNPGLTPERPLKVDAQIVVPHSAARIYLDNEPLTGTPAPFIQQGYSMVPMRHIVENKGGVVVWLPDTKEVNAWANNTFMGVTLGKREARINAEVVLLPVAPEIRSARTMVPLRYLMGALDLQVEFNASTGTYYLVSQAQD